MISQLGLVFIYIFYTVLSVVPAPLGRIDFFIIPPPSITGSLLIDSIIDLNFAAFKNAVGHLILPVALGLINTGPFQNDAGYDGKNA